MIVAPSQTEGFHLLDARRLLSLDFDVEKLLAEVNRLDYALLKGLSQLHEGDAAQWNAVLLRSPDTWRLLVDPSNNIVGYWQFVSLSDRLSARLRMGHLMDSEITSNELCQLDKPGWYDIYMIAICIAKGYQRTTAARRLLLSFFDLTSQMARRRVFWRNVYANAFTDGGAHLCRSFGLEPVINHIDQGTVYCGRFSKILRLRAAGRHLELRNSYAYADGRLR